MKNGIFGNDKFLFITHLGKYCIGKLLSEVQNTLIGVDNLRCPDVYLV